MHNFLVLLFAFIAVHGLTIAQKQSLRLSVNPPFIFLNENIPVGEQLKNVKICAEYSGKHNLSIQTSSGDPLGYFRFSPVSKNCWTLVLLRQLDADQQLAEGTRGQTFSLAIRCTDGRNQAFANLDIQVMDVNDNPPLFIDTPSQILLPEKTRPGTKILTATTFDPDTGVGGINGFALKDSYNGTFHIANGSCSELHCSADIFLQRPLNYDQRNVYTLEILAFDGAGRIALVNTVQYPVVVNVADEQTNPPVFLTDAGIRYVREDTPIGTAIFQVQAVDGDSGVKQPNAIVYSIVNDGHKRYFGINATSGWVYVNSILDRESPEVFQRNGALGILVLAKENTPPPQPMSAQNLTVIIEDVDDEVPRCNQTNYFAEIGEGSQNLIPVSFTNAQELYVYDHDEGQNGQFYVTLEGEQGIFDVTPKVVFNEANLLLRVKNSSALDFERLKTLSFRVILNGVGPSKRSGACQVTVSVLDTNDNPPTFNETSFFGAIEENQAEGSIVTQIVASDVDSANYLPIMYSISGKGAELFSVDENGVITTRKELDREGEDRYHLTLTATDDSGKGNTASVPLEIEVLDENDNAPQCSEDFYTAYLLENSITFTQQPSGFFIKATDKDEAGTENSELTYFLHQYNYGFRNFSINGSTGEIVPKAPGVDLELMNDDYFNLTVFVQDSGRPRPLNGSCSDTNDNYPIFEQSQYEAEIFENATQETEIISVSATDADRSLHNSQISYRITNIQDKFSIDSVSGRISMAPGANLDTDLSEQNLYKLNIVAVDQGIPQRSGSTIVNIRILDVNDKSPKFGEKLYKVSVSEDVPVGTVLLNLTALDTDANALLQYSISGVESVVPLAATSTSKVPFAIDVHTGILFTTEQLDRETMESLRLVVSVVDVNGVYNVPQVSEAFVDVVIGDVNDNPPQFEKQHYNKTILENAEIGTVLFAVSAVDLDKNNVISYSISSASYPLFTIDERTGELSVADLIDYEEVRQINLTVAASDNANPPLMSFTNVTIFVLDQNDNSPIFYPSPSFKLVIPENTPNGTLALRLNATDRDSRLYGRISYFLLTELGQQSSFSVDENTGELFVVGPLDRERKSTYSLTVQAVDDYTGHVNPDSHEATALVHVVISDVNDNAPEFIPSTAKQFTLNENNPAGMLIYTFSAQDSDEVTNGNGAVEYSILSIRKTLDDIESSTATAIGNERQLFVINKKSGALSLAKNLTGMYGKYELMIEARDRGLPEPMYSVLTVTIDVEDFNDHKPEIVQPLPKQTFFVQENNFTKYMVVTRVKALDVDHGHNAEVVYSLKETSANDDWRYFNIDSVSGNVYLKQALDYEKQHRYSLTAKACDVGLPPLCDDVEFSVDVIDVDDNCPSFERSMNYTDVLYMPENKPAGSIVADIVAATDADSLPENTRVCYEIVAGSGKFAFKMFAENSTQLQTTVSLDRETNDEYYLVVQATDCTDNKRCSDWSTSDSEDSHGYVSSDKSLVLVKVEVVDVNDNPPVFAQKLFRGGVQYDMRLGSRVTKLRATDLDSVDRGQLRYFISGPIVLNLVSGSLNTDREPFLLNSTNGDITTNIAFLPSWRGSFEFKVMVNDTDGNADTAHVTVELIFDSQPNQIWSEATEIISLLSDVTESNATVDDVTSHDSKHQTGAAAQSKVVVHFVYPDGDVMPVEDALKSMDVPNTAAQKSAKQELITVYRLRYAGQNSEKVFRGSVEHTIIFALTGAICGLLLFIVVLISLWAAQVNRYKTKLKAATTIAFGSADKSMSSIPNIPGTNLHAGSNPIWSGHYGSDNFALDYELQSNNSDNSLDENAIDVQVTRNCLYESNTDNNNASNTSQITTNSNGGYYTMNLGLARPHTYKKKGEGPLGVTPRGLPVPAAAAQPKTVDNMTKPGLTRHDMPQSNGRVLNNGDVIHSNGHLPNDKSQYNGHLRNEMSQKSNGQNGHVWNDSGSNNGTLYISDNNNNKHCNYSTFVQPTTLTGKNPQQKRDAPKPPGKFANGDAKSCRDETLDRCVTASQLQPFPPQFPANITLASTEL